MKRAYLSLGSNIEPEQHIHGAIRALGARYGSLVISPVYQTAAVGFDGDDFLNLVVGIDTAEDAATLAANCRAIETALGRRRGDQRFSARTLDIDVLTLGDEIRDASPALPRDEILKYAFVIKPLADIAPDVRHPLDGRDYAEIWRAFVAASDKAPELKPFPMDFSADLVG